MTNDILKSIERTSKLLSEDISLPKRQRIYVFFVSTCYDMGVFGSPGQAIYVGIAEKDLTSRDINTHLQVGKTGSSSLRRSLGAILKTQLNLASQPRDKAPKKIRRDKFKFNQEGEQRLTTWMTQNLRLGYWVSKEMLMTERLRNEEEKIIVRLKPTLDLDRRTRVFNPLAAELTHLRRICQDEAYGINSLE